MLLTLAQPARACTCVSNGPWGGYLLYPPGDVLVATDSALVWLDARDSHELVLSGPSGAVGLSVTTYDNGLYGFRVAQPEAPLEPESLYVVNDGTSTAFFSTGTESTSAPGATPVVRGVCGEAGYSSACLDYLVQYEIEATATSAFYVIEFQQADQPTLYALTWRREAPGASHTPCGANVELVHPAAPMATRLAALWPNGELSPWSAQYVGALGDPYERVCFDPLDLDGEPLPPCGCEDAAALSLLGVVPFAWRSRRERRPRGGD